MAWYRAGTATFTNGSRAVIGSGTAWSTNVRAGDEIIGPDSISREVETVTSDTALTMVEPYTGATAAGAAYKVKPIQGWNRDVAAQLAALINDYGSVEAALTVLAGNLGLGKSPNASAKLDVAGQVWVDAPSGDATLRLLASGAEKGKLAVTSAGRVYVESNGAEVMTWLNGNVGVGMAAPGARLDVKSQINLTNSVGTSFPGVKGSVFGYSTGYSALVIGATSGNVTTCIGVDPAANTSPSFTGNGIEVMFRNGVRFITPNTGNDGYNECLTMLNGNVGIGTLSPAAALHVNGTLRVDGGTTGSASAGGAALPAQPAGFLTIILSGVERKLPYYLP